MNYNKKIITIKKVLELKPCYSESELEELRKKNNLGKKVSVLEILKSKIPTSDILWLVFCPDFIEEKILHELSIIFATRALKQERKAGREPHPDSWKAIKMKKKWLAGKATDEELRAAESAAWSAEKLASEVAWESLWSASTSAVRAAAVSASYSASRSAYRSAVESAWFAAVSASESALESASISSPKLTIEILAKRKEQKWQIKQIIRLLEVGK
ncbi:MAG: hypothetical protein PVF17_00890 [Ignavibacteria bacterium]